MSWQPIETAPKDREILIRLKRGDKSLDKFVLNVLPGEIVRAQRGSDESIAKEIAAVQKELHTDIPVYHGTR